MNTIATVTKRKESDENGHDEPPEKKTKDYSIDDIKQIEDLYNIILDIKSKLNAAYLENSLKLKKSFESIQLTVPELKQGFTVPLMLNPEEPKQQGHPSQSQKPSAEAEKSSAEPEKPSAETEKSSAEPEEDLYNTILDIKSKLNAAYLENSLKLKKSFESIQLTVPELKEGFTMPLMLNPEEPKPSSEPGKPASQSTKPSTVPAGKVAHNWMMKHNKPVPDLIELMPNTGIYVDRIELSRAKYKASDMRKFGRGLLPVVFSIKALRICSYTGLGIKRKRPGLDEYAKTVLMAYVTKHAEESNWEIVSRKLMTMSMSSKVKEFNYYLRTEHSGF